MGRFLVPFLALQFLYTTTLSKILNTSPYASNSISDKFNDYSVLLSPEFSNENDEILYDEDALAGITDITDEDLPIVQTFQDKTELKFRQPIESVNVDYLRNAVILKFHKNNAKSVTKLDTIENEKKKSTQDNFIRFGKRSNEELPLANSLDRDFDDKNIAMRSERSHQSARDARGDNFMRFGRSGNVKNDFMRFGRGGNDFMRFGRSPSQDFMRFGRTDSQDFMRFGRATGSDNFMRFGRSPSQDFMRFGRTPSQDFMRFGRSPNQDFMRFGRAGQDNFMRFGRSPHDNLLKFGRNSPKLSANSNFMRYSRPDNFMRFGRAHPQNVENFMRFGKSTETFNDKNASQPLMGKSELKQAVKLIHAADKNADNENPVDKAMKVLFDQHQQQTPNDKAQSDELNSDSAHQDHETNDSDMDMDYFLKVSQ